MPDVKERLLLGERRRSRVWSVEFLPNASVGIRRDLARGLQSGIEVGGSAARNDFDRVPIFQRPIFNATWDRLTRRWVDLVPKGDPRFSWSPTEPYREVLYRCRPFFYSLDMSANHAPLRVSVSDRPLPGFTLAPMFQNATDHVYRPCFELSVGEDGLPHSRAGLVPIFSDHKSLMAHARAYDARGQLESIKDWFSDALLLLVEFARWDFVTVMRGNAGTTPLACGKGLQSISASSGFAAVGAPCVWRGKENPWKNVNSALCDVFLRKATVDGTAKVTLCHLDDMSLYDGTLNEHYTEVGAFVSNANGSCDIYGFSMGNGFFYPSQRKLTGIATKGASYLYSDGSDRTLAVAVGGSSGTAMLSTSVRPSPMNFESIDLSNWRAKQLGARLILNEGR